MKTKVLRQIVHLKRFLLNQDVQNGIVIALLCIVTVGGFMLSTGDRLQSISSAPSRHYGQSSYHGATGYTVSSGSGVSVVSHSTLGHGVSGGSGVSGSTGESGLSGGTGVSVSIGMIGHTTKISNVAFGGGGGVYSGGGGGSGSSGVSGSTGGSGGTGFSGISGFSGIAVLSRGSGTKTVMGLGTTPNSDGLDLYEGDKPGDITGAENAVVDNTLVSNFGQPIGDVLWPLLLMALMYVLWIKKNERKGSKWCPIRLFS